MGWGCGSHGPYLAVGSGLSPSTPAPLSFLNKDGSEHTSGRSAAMNFGDKASDYRGPRAAPTEETAGAPGGSGRSAAMNFANALGNIAAHAPLPQMPPCGRSYVPAQAILSLCCGS